MMVGSRLAACLGGDEADRAVASVVAALGKAAAETAALLARGAPDEAGTAPDLAAQVADGFVRVLREAPVAVVAQRGEAPETLDPSAPVAVALSALDGLANLAGNMPAGTLVSLRPAGPDAFGRPGRAQLAAGVITYGPRTGFALALGGCTRIFTLDPAGREFRLSRDAVTIPATSPLYAVDAAQARFWDAPMRAFVDDCLRGAEGPRGQDFAMSWCASLAAGAQRVLARGGVHLSPGETRRGGANGPTRLVHEAQAVALVVEAAGGAATDGRDAAILDLPVLDLHQCTPFVFGSAEEVACVGKYHDGRRHSAARSPLFGQRGLLRA